MRSLAVWVAGFVLALSFVGLASAAGAKGSDPIAEAGFVRIGGIDQWISIHGDHRDDPVLLILHGGPGMTNAPFAPAMEGWRRHFIVVDWDQRGAGRTFGRNRATGHGEMTFGRLTRDGLEVAEHLRGRLHKRRIAVFGVSAGSVVGLSMVQARPELFSAYVGSGQFVDGGEADAIAYRRTLERATATGNAEAVKALTELGPPPWAVAGRGNAVRGWVGRTTPLSDPATRMNVPNMLRALPDYTPADMQDALDGFTFSSQALAAERDRLGVRSLGTRFAVPIYIFQGAGDLNTPTELVARWFAEIRAPAKKMVVVENASHGAFFTHADQLGALLAETVAPVARRAD